VALPIDAKVNICTAPGMVLDAFTPGRQEFGTDPDSLYKNRQGAGGGSTGGELGSSSSSGSSGCFPSLSEYQQSFPSPQLYTQASSMFATTSSYFRLHAFVTIDTAEFNLYSLLLMDSTGNVRPLLRTFTPD
jgi:hypothetical protein